MDHFTSITKKLSDYLVESKGFIKKGEYLEKILTDEDDICCPRESYILMEKGSLFGGNWECFYQSIEDNYVSGIEDNFDNWLDLSEGEEEYLSEGEEEETGWDRVDEWIRDHLDVACNRALVDRLMAQAIKEYDDDMLDKLLLA